MNKTVLKVIRILVILICIGVICYESIQIYNDQKEYTVAENEYNELVDKATSVAMHSDDDAEIVDYPLITVNHDELLSINEDYVGFLYFPALEISYPIVKEDTVNEYLYKTFEGKSNKAGCIFEDILSNERFTGYHDIVFGHNMKNGSMFGALKKLYQGENPDLLAKEPYVYVYTKDHVYKYRVFAYYNTTVGSGSYTVVETKSQYVNFIKYIRPLTKYEIPEDIDFSTYPSVLTLSTCSGRSGSGRRFVVHTVKVGSYKLGE